MDETLPTGEVTELEGDQATQRWLLALQLFYDLEWLEHVTKEWMSRKGFEETAS